MNRVIILYIPILHQGYIDFFQKHGGADILFILGEELIKEYTSLHKEIRQIDPFILRDVIKSGKLFRNIVVLNRLGARLFAKKSFMIITANDTISLGVVEKYFPNHQKEIDTVFLRWDEKSVYSKQNVKYDRISTDEFDRKMMALARVEAQKSSDWWRHVGAVLVKNNCFSGKIIIKNYNKHVPSEHIPYALGDPRDFIQAGKNSELSTALHAEQLLIAEAARTGIGFEGTDIYITVFPCPVCAKMIAYSGIKRIFFSSGHASLDGETILRTKGVELIVVQ